MYAIGQKFDLSYPPEAAVWCNENSAMMVAVEGGFEIQALSAPTIEDQLAAIETEYYAKFTALDASLLAALWAAGANEVANRQALSAKRQELVVAKDEAIMNILLTAS